MPDGEPDEKCLTGRSTLPAGPPAAEVGSLGGLTEGPLPVPVTHTNRKGVTCYLCHGMTKRFRPRYYFSREPRGTALAAVPEGYVITESVNGVVSLSRARQPTFLPEEIAAVQSALTAHPKGQNYRVSAKKDFLEVYERIGLSSDDLVRDFMKEGYVPLGGARAFIAQHEQRAQFTPILRFRLVEPRARLFTVDRMTFRGDGGWLMVGGPAALRRLLKRVIPALGRDAFFELL